MAIKTINPATNKVEKIFTEMTDEEVDKALTQSAAAFEDWKKAGPEYHRVKLNMLGWGVTDFGQGPLRA